MRFSLRVECNEVEKSVIDLSPALRRGGTVLWSAKVPKALCQSGKGPFTHTHIHQKTAALCFVC